MEMRIFGRAILIVNSDVERVGHGKCKPLLGAKVSSPILRVMLVLR